ncbi:Isochorismatase hydrolase [Cylindrobasidium torrendii FP15055 ss-10]|uniref:Isochorismatase hydrolase n=1 Tax=Cylindrobasidium torrendii FP15055 ss-10 TaxID=1314674 RepID=A0A0D7B8N4_9AGAR|nr:Isochorismatase hydrolase [Cylindrobasidium torrendii FP15055 ss-10]
MANPHCCLLLLDVQIASLRPPPHGIPASATVGPNIDKVLQLARSVTPAPTIVHVRNTGDCGDPDEPNTPGWQLATTPLAHEFVLDKRKNNAFIGTRLGDIIHPHAEIIVVGLHSDFSLRATCSAALDRGNEVIVIRGAHGTFDRLEVLYGSGITPASKVALEIEAELEEAGVHIFDMKDLTSIFKDR